MPADNIDRSIKKGTGELEGVVYEEIVYEGYGPEGVAVVVEVMTDNRNRTVADIRHLFTRYNGNLGPSGCATRMFDRVGLIEVDKSKATEEQLMEVALEAGAQDILEEENVFEVITPVESFFTVVKALASAKVPTESAELTRRPQLTVKLEGKPAETMLKLYTALEDHDDVQHLYANFDISDEIMESFSA
jgi:YebC/PmpR family DNA-binding regulatory protein